MKKLVLLISLVAVAPLAHAQDTARVSWYRAHPDQTTAKLKWCVEHQSGEADCGAALQACSELLRTDPQASCQSPTAQ